MYVCIYIYVLYIYTVTYPEIFWGYHLYHPPTLPSEWLKSFEFNTFTLLLHRFPDIPSPNRLIFLGSVWAVSKFKITKSQSKSYWICH